MPNSKPTPGNANLRIGVPTAAQPAALHASVSPAAEQEPANAEIGAPRWHSRGYLPHLESAAIIQHVTFHLADSLPQSVLIRLDSELRALPAEKRDAERRKKIERWIDAGHGSCLLRSPSIASLVQRTLLFFDGQRYRLLAWVIMPNHVHVLFEPINGWTVAKIVASWKKFTATEISKRQHRSSEPLSAPIWHREYWDRFIRDKTHLIQVIDYISQNPVKAGLAPTPQAYPWSSANPGNANPGNANLRIGALP